MIFPVLLFAKNSWLLSFYSLFLCIKNIHIPMHALLVYYDFPQMSSTQTKKAKKSRNPANFFLLSLLFYKNMHQIGNVTSDRSVDTNSIPAAHCSSPPCFPDRSTAVIGVGIAAMITVIPRRSGSIGSSAVNPNTIPGTTISLTKRRLR